MRNQSQFSLLSILVVIFGIIALTVTIYAITGSTEFRIKAAPGAVLMLNGSPIKAHADDTLDIALDVNAETTPIQTVFINLVYPIKKIEFLSLDTDHSPFDMDSGTYQQNGYVTVARSTAFPLSGRIHIATLHFKAKEDVALSDIQPVAGTSILSTENKNIYGHSFSYASEQPQPTPPLLSIQFFVSIFTNLLHGK